MRDYKFRGKNIKGNWEYGNLVISDHNRLYEIIDKERRYRGELNKETIGQYTGLKDKNGKEIYEGDIIFIKEETKLLDIKGKVEYSNIFAQFIITNTGSIVSEAEPLGDYEEEEIEVIGNIYDTPELLEEGE